MKTVPVELCHKELNQDFFESKEDDDWDDDDDDDDIDDDDYDGMFLDSNC